MTTISEAFTIFAAMIGGALVLDTTIVSKAKKKNISKALYDVDADFGLPHAFALKFDFFFFGSAKLFFLKTLLFSFSSLSLVALLTVLEAPPPTTWLERYPNLFWKWPLIFFLLLNVPCDLISLIKTRWLLYFAAEKNSVPLVAVVVVVSFFINLAMWVLAWRLSMFAMDALTSGENAYTGGYIALFSEAWAMSIWDRAPLFVGNTMVFPTYLSTLTLSSLMLEVFLLLLLSLSLLSRTLVIQRKWFGATSFSAYPITFLSIPIALTVIIFEWIIV